MIYQEQMSDHQLMENPTDEPETHQKYEHHIARVAPMDFFATLGSGCFVVVVRH